eukprot:MONOS_6121.1-p1 / transcript=MONOS_6121.1 / gene=MONOS_6121 / organism=Monocercomonoides_exilis_PA203 / gene_product=unspecified product / transcript_product=unspecified product / location=Mono_scaffold00188:84866-85979(+) / protein_length=334 / sequence_SO=supercontig / SO=protein_coding / is_pseudo=false
MKGLGTKGLAAVLEALLIYQQTIELILTNNSIGVEGLEILQQFLTSPSIRVMQLNISMNQLKGGGFKLSEIILTSPCLTEIDLSNNGLLDRDITDIFIALASTPSVVKVNLSHNSITERGGRDIGRMLNDTKLKDLDISWNELNDKGAIAITDALKQNTTLSKINMGTNGLTGLVALQVAQILTTSEKYQTLTSIDLSGNSLFDSKTGDNGICAIFTALQANSGVILKELKMRGCVLGAKSIQLIPTALSHCVVLKLLDLREAKFCSQAKAIDVEGTKAMTLISPLESREEVEELRRSTSELAKHCQVLFREEDVTVSSAYKEQSSSSSSSSLT